MDLPFAPQQLAERERPPQRAERSRSNDRFDHDRQDRFKDSLKNDRPREHRSDDVQHSKRDEVERKQRPDAPRPDDRPEQDQGDTVQERRPPQDGETVEALATTLDAIPQLLAASHNAPVDAEGKSDLLNKLPSGLLPTTDPKATSAQTTADGTLLNTIPVMVSDPVATPADPSASSPTMQNAEQATRQPAIDTPVPALTELARNPNTPATGAAESTAGTHAQAAAAVTGLIGGQQSADPQLNGQAQQQAQMAMQAPAEADPDVLPETSFQRVVANTSTAADTGEALTGLRPAGANAAVREAPVTPVVPATPQNQASEANPMDKAVGNQIQRALVERLPGGERMLTLRLTPPELGTVRIEVIERGGHLQVKIGAEDDSVRASLERVLPQLRSEMRGHDTPINSIDLTDTFLSDKERDGRQTQQNGNQGQGRQPRGGNQSGFSLDHTPVDEDQMIDRSLGGRADTAGVYARA